MGNNQEKQIEPQQCIRKSKLVQFKYINPIKYHSQDQDNFQQSMPENYINPTLNKTLVTSISNIKISNSKNQIYPKNVDTIKMIQTQNVQEDKQNIMSIMGSQNTNSNSDNESNYQQNMNSSQIRNQQQMLLQQISVKWNSFVKIKKRNYHMDYLFLSEIGRGGFGCVYKAQTKYTGIYRAAKKIKKNALDKQEHKKLFSQMGIMMLLDHPNIAKLYEVYDYKNYYVLILEYCNGGQLYSKIANKSLKQADIACIMKQIFRSLMYLHSKGIVHRDLKPQNMLLEKQTSLIKIIDFGIAAKKKKHEKLSSRLGTPYYIAPQVILKSYNQKCDLWACGVILYMMIAGYPPFRGQTQQQVLENIIKDPVLFRGSIWHKINPKCLDLLMKLLQKNPKQRLSAKEAFNHEYLKNIEEYNSSPSNTKLNQVYNKINSFHFKNKLQAVVHTYVVSQLLSSEERLDLLHYFKQMDINDDGVISATQLRQTLNRMLPQLKKQNIQRLLKIIDTNQSGMIDYTQFLVAGLNADKITKQHLEKAFAYFDIDHSGTITIDEVTQFLDGTNESQQSIKKMFDLVDQNGDGYISKQQFINLLSKQFMMN